MLLSELAGRLGCELRGPDADISGAAALDQAGPAHLSFLANPKYAKLLPATRAGGVIVDVAHADAVPTSALVSASPYLDFARALAFFDAPQAQGRSGVSSQAYVHPEASVDPAAEVHPFACVGARARVEAGARIFPFVYVGDDCVVEAGAVLYPGSTLMDRTRVGQRSVLQPGAVLGSDGFGFAPSPRGLVKVPQIGTVAIASDVEIGANTTIDRAALGVTSVGQGAKIDNLVQIAHNCEIGPHSVIVAQVGLSGSTKLGVGVMMGGQAATAGHLTIGDGSRVAAQSGVNRDLPPGSEVGSGIPAMDKSVYLRAAMSVQKLPELIKTVRRLEREIENLKAALADSEQAGSGGDKA